MAAGDETQANPRPTFPEPGPGRADETIVNNVVPPPRPAPRQPATGLGEHGGPGAFASAPSDGGIFDDVPPLAPDPDRGARRSAPPRPHILANQANDWESNLQEMEVVKSRRTGLFFLFLVALLAVALIALGLAAWSVLGDRDGGSDVASTETTVPGESVPGETVPGATDTTIPAPTTVLDPNALRITIGEDPFICDGGTREFALIGGAEPNEQISFTSPQSEGLRDGTADANGELPVRWQCDPAQAGTTWELTATGLTSGKSATFLFAGALAPPGSEPAAPTALTVTVTEDPFACDGTARVFAQLSGADPNEEVAFSSPQSPGLRSGTADANGELPVRWSCDATQAGTVWELTATGVTSGRTVTFSFTGS